MILNEYRLNPARREDQEVIVKQMEQFFFGEGAVAPKEYVPPPTSTKSKGETGVSPVQRARTPAAPQPAVAFAGSSVTWLYRSQSVRRSSQR